MTGGPPSHGITFQALDLRQSGPPPNIEYPPEFLAESRRAQIIAGNAICQIVGNLFFFARVYSRLFIIRTWKAEDWTLVAAWLSATGYSIGAYGQVAHGAGKHLAALTNFEDAVTSQKYAFANVQLLFFAIALPKLSICFAYLRIFYSDKVGRYLIQGLMVLLVLLIIPFFVENLLTCKPLHVYWTELRPLEKCLNDLPALFVNGSLNGAVDLALMGILIPRILHLKMSDRQKRVLLAIVSLGSLAVVAAIVRMVRVGTTLANYGKGNTIPDPPWDTYDVTIWTSTEIYVSLVCAAAPGVKPLVSMLLPRLLGTTLRSRSRSTGVQAYGTGGPIELSGRTKRNTLITGSTLHKSASGQGLTAGRGQWIEVGRGADEESLGGKSDEDSYHKRLRADGGIIKKSEIRVQTSDAIRDSEPSYPQSPKI